MFEAKIGLNAETISAVNALTAAILALAGGGKMTNVITAASANVAPSADPVYWRSPKENTFGIAADEAEYKALKKVTADLMKIPQGKYDTLVADAAAAGAGGSSEEE